MIKTLGTVMLSLVKPNVTMFSVSLLNVIILSVVLPNVVMLSVVAPFCAYLNSCKKAVISINEWKCISP